MVNKMLFTARYLTISIMMKKYLVWYKCDTNLRFIKWVASEKEDIIFGQFSLCVVICIFMINTIKYDPLRIGNLRNKNPLVENHPKKDRFIYRNSNDLSLEAHLVSSCHRFAYLVHPN